MPMKKMYREDEQTAHHQVMKLSIILDCLHQPQQDNNQEGREPLTLTLNQFCHAISKHKIMY